MGAFSVFTGAVYLLVSPLLSHRPPHPEADSVGAATPWVLRLCDIYLWYNIIACFRIKALIWTTAARNTTHKNTENTGTGLSDSGRNGRKLIYVSQQDRAA
jgi:hypothetical protein